MAKIKVAVIFGGTSGEHYVSLLSAGRVIAGIPEDKYDVVPIGITKKGRWYYYPGDYKLIPTGEWEKNPDCTPAILSPDCLHSGFIKLEGENYSYNKVDVIFPLLYGKNGEDGAIQGLIEMSGIPFVGCNHTASANCMDKEMTKTILNFSGIKTADWITIRKSELSHLNRKCDQIMGKFEFPIFVKPASSGSSIGVNKVYDIESLEDAIKYAFTHGKKAIAEEYIEGREVECAVFGNDSLLASTVGEIITDNDFYDYEAKYITSCAKKIVPAAIDNKLNQAIKETAMNAFKVMGCSGMARIDFFIKDNNEIILNEINTMPEFTPTGMYEALMEYTGMPFSELLCKLISMAFDIAA